jgi:hypothetical protein
MEGKFSRPISVLWWAMTLVWAALILYLSTRTFGSDFTHGLLAWTSSVLSVHVAPHPFIRFVPVRTASLLDCGWSIFGAAVAMLVLCPRDPISSSTRFGRSRLSSLIRKKISLTNWELISARLLRLACVSVLGCILVAGLWPFHSPRNQVTWFAAGNGVHFGSHGTILSSGKFPAVNVPANAPCSFEIWLMPDLTWSSGTLFAFYTPGSPRQFSLRQSISDLALQTDMRDGRYRTRTALLYVGDIFRKGKPLFITVTLRGGKASVYIDGALARTTPRFPLSRHDFEGELIIANMPEEQYGWSGLLRGLAFYDQALSPEQVYHHYVTWIENGRPDVTEDEHAAALYLFDEHAGHVIHDQARSGVDLYIPDRYRLFDQAFLTPVWREFRPTWSFAEDVLVNIGGFVPLGFLFFAYFALVARINRPALVTILLGFAVSLMIETLQAFLPTRNSGTTDLITNTLGTCLGVGLFRFFWRVLIGKTSG